MDETTTYFNILWSHPRSDYSEVLRSQNEKISLPPTDNENEDRPHNRLEYSQTSTFSEIWFLNIYLWWVSSSHGILVLLISLRSRTCTEIFFGGIAWGIASVGCNYNSEITKYFNDGFVLMDDEEVRVRTTTLKAAVCGVGEMVNDGLWLDYEICMYACTEEDNCRGVVDILTRRGIHFFIIPIFI